MEFAGTGHDALVVGTRTIFESFARTAAPNAVAAARGRPRLGAPSAGRHSLPRLTSYCVVVETNCADSMTVRLGAA
jgi:hypothetical protein